MSPSSTTEPTFDEVTIALLKESATHYGGFIYPIVRDRRTNRIIDGHHRVEVARRCDEQGVSLTYKVIFEHTETDEEIEAMAIDLNKTRRQWNTAEERRTQVQMLAATTVPTGRSGKGGRPAGGPNGKPSSRQIAKALGIAKGTVQNDLKETGQKCPVSEPTAPQPISEAKGAKASDLVREGLRALCRQYGHTKATSLNTSAARTYLAEQGATIPAHLRPKAKATQPSPSDVEPIPPVEPIAPSPSEGVLDTVEPTIQHPQVDGAEERDLDPGDSYNKPYQQVRDDCAAKVQQTDRPADFKRAVLLLVELDDIIQDAYNRTHPEPWNVHDWGYVSTEIKSISGLAYQRATQFVARANRQCDLADVRSVEHRAPGRKVCK